MDKFWIVIGPRNTISARHPNRELAMREAERLCRDTLKPFVVMEALAVCEPTSPPVRWSPLTRAA